MINKLTLILAVVLLLLALFGCQKEESPKPAEGQVVFDSVPSTDGVMIQYQTQGQGDHALVFVHGWGCDRTLWEKQFEEFAKNYRVVGLDLAGHGLSGKNRSDWSVANFGADVAAVVNKLGLNDVVLIGHSMGGPVCIEAARLLPGKVKGIVGVDIFQNFAAKYPPEAIDTWLAPFRTNFTATVDTFAMMLFSPTADSSLVNMVRVRMRSNDSVMGVATLRNTNLYDYVAGLKGLNVPIRCINAETYPTMVDSNRTFVPSFDVEIIPGTGHFVHMEKPEEFNQALRRALAAFWPTPATKQE